MDALFTVGIIVLVGFIFGELVRLIKLPRVTGYIIAGIILAASWDVVPILGAVAIAMVGVVALVSLNLPPVPALVVGWTQMGVGLMVALLAGAGARLGW